VKTSMIIATHNRAAMVKSAVESALAFEQPGRREIIVVNDGSTDNTPEVLAEFGDRIRVIHAKHGERSRARNAGIQAATGDYVAFLDDDDVFLPGGISTLEAAFDVAPQDVALMYGTYRYLRTNPDHPVTTDIPPGVGTSGWAFPIILKNCFFLMGTVLIRRSVLSELNGFDEKHPPVEDYDLWLRMSLRWKVQHHDVPMAEIRLHYTNSLCDQEKSWRLSDGLRQHYLAQPDVLRYARDRAAEGDSQAAPLIAEEALRFALQRWWKGDTGGSRELHAQAFRLSPKVAMKGIGELWRLWIPLRKPGFIRQKPPAEAQ
jgi:glycosyltransferase involved in cell wall biosynthesis